MPKVRQYQSLIAVRLPPETDGELRELLEVTQLTQSELLRLLLGQAVRQALAERHQEAAEMT